MEWLSLVPALAVCIILLIVPGLLVTLAVRMRGFDAVALAPAVSIGLIAVSAVLAPIAGIGWALWVPFAGGIVTALVFGLIAWGFRAARIEDYPVRSRPRGRKRHAGSAGHDDVERAPWNSEAGTGESASSRGSFRWTGPGRLGGDLVPARWFSRGQLAYWASFVIAALVMLRTITNAIGAPGRFSQTFDNNFHLNVIRYIVEQHNASSLTVSAMTAGGGAPTFYPAAWHDVVSLVFMSTGQGSIPMATNAMIVTVAVVVWPLSVLYLMRSMMRFNLPTVLTAGAVLSGFAAFPVLLMYFGVLYPNFLGIALIPAGLGLLINVLRVSAIRRVTTIQSILLGIVVALGIGFAHPNAAMSLVIMTVPILLVRGAVQIWRAANRRTSVGVVIVQVILIAAGLWLIWYLWGIVRPEAGAATWGPATSDTQAFGEALLNSPLSLTQAQWVLSILAILGTLVVLYTRRNVWLALVYGVLIYYYICVRWLQWDQDRMWATGVWYNDPYRLAALLPVAAVPLALIGIHCITQALMGSAVVERWKHRGPQVLGVVSALTVILALALTQFARPLNDMVNASYWSYYASEDAQLVDSDELDVIHHIDDYVPDKDTVIVNPWTGGALAYALADRHVTAAHTLYTPTDNAKIFDGSLNQANQDPKVCQAVKDDDAKYVLDFGTDEVNQGDHSGAFQGLQNLEESGVAIPVYQSGDAKLLKITACD
ncbi:DUF6541 family protein [Rothia koreensis]|uniref:DUF6541 family protein n=1 Tax=Rothia koreensis TaxID=592378 RepID=UPI0037C9D7EE